MKLLRLLTCTFCLLLSACAGVRVATNSTEEFVEIDNPVQTMATNASATIWLPKSYVANGIPRGGVVLNKGYEKMVQPTMSATSPKQRISILEVGGNSLAVRLSEKIRSTSYAIVVEQQPEAAPPFLATKEERSAYVLRLKQDSSINAVLFVSAVETVTSGKSMAVELYDGMGGVFLRRFEAVIPPYPESDPVARAAVIDAVLTTVEEKIREVVAHIPWLCRVIAVEGNKIYIGAGKESGIYLGQRLRIYSSGKGVSGLGFDPGRRVGFMEVKGFIGPDGAYGTLMEGERVELTDIVGVD